MEVNELFEKHNEEFLKFDRVEQKLSSRPDIHAFLLLDTLFPGNADIVCSALHDQIYLDVSQDQIDELTEGNVIDLLRCGILYDQDSDSLFSFV